MKSLSEKISNFGRETTGTNAANRAALRATAKATRMRLWQAEGEIDRIIRASTDRLAGLPEPEWSEVLGELAAALLPYMAAVEVLPVVQSHE